MKQSWLVLVVLAPLALGCTELPELSAGTCGNGIVEAGEDCDTHDPSCRQPGKTLECRSDCSVDASTGQRRACQPGYGCGTDDICRAASGTFEFRGDTAHEITLSVETGDFDGDGRSDVLAGEPSRTVAYFHDSTGKLATSYALQLFAPDAQAVQLTADEPASDEPDSFVSAMGAVTVARGSEDRTLTRVAYAPFGVDQETLHYLTIDAFPGPFGSPFSGDEIVSFRPISDTTAAVREVRIDQDLFTVDYVPQGTLALHANLDPSTPCDELVLAGYGWGQARIYRTCKSGKGGWDWGGEQTPTLVTLPAGWTISAGASGRSPLAALGDLNGDDVPDLVVSASNADKSAIFGAFGVLNGTFHSDPTTLPSGDPLPAGDGKLQPLAQVAPIAALLDGVPLAIGTISDDDKVDFVGRRFILFSDPSASCNQLPGYRCIESPDDPWAQAALGDFNLDGSVDVVALTENGTALDFFGGFEAPNGKLFNHTPVTSIGLMSAFIVGDFDGDKVVDFAVQETRGFLEDTSSLAIAWGRLFGVPESPISIARFPQIFALASGNLAAIDSGVVDGMTDIGLVSGEVGQGPDGGPEPVVSDLRAALFYGRGDRQLQSPFSLFDGQNEYLARRAVAGRFDADAHNDIVAVGQHQPGNPFGNTGTELPPTLWLLPSTGAAQVSPQNVSYQPVADERFSPCGTRAVAVDLEGDGIDELVLLGKEKQHWTGLTLVARANVADGKTWLTTTQVEGTEELVFDGFLATINCDVALEALVSQADEEFLFYSGEALARDLNGDGLREIVALGYGVNGIERPAPSLVVYRNTGSGSLDVSGRILLPLPLYATPNAPPEIAKEFGPGATGVTVIQADADPELEILVGNLLYAWVFDVALDAAGGVASLGEPRRIEGFVDPDDMQTGGEFLFSISLAAADIDGDGVEDFVGAGPGGVRVFYGVPVLR